MPSIEPVHHLPDHAVYSNCHLDNIDLKELGVMEATGKGLVEFWSFAAERGLMNGNTAGALRAASKEVLKAVDGEAWEEVNIRGIDVADYAQRFERLRISKFKPNSLTVYKSRFRNAVDMYLSYLENPSGWRYKAARPSALRSGASKSHDVQAQKAPLVTSSGLDAASPESTLEYPYPLRAGLVIRLRLPKDLTKTEARRLSIFLESLAVDAVPQLPAGRSVATES